MNRRYVKFAFLLLSVMILVALSFVFAACTEKNNGEGEGGGNGIIVDPPQETPHTQIIITIDGEDTDAEYTVEVGQALTIRKYSRAHYTFTKYRFVAPNGLTYESDKDGQKWKTSDENSFKVLNWSWETEMVRVEALFTEMSYKIKYRTGINDDTEVRDLNMEVTYGTELTGNFVVALGKMLNDHKNSNPGYEVDGVCSIDASGAKNQIVDVNVRFVETAASFLDETYYYLDDVNKECVLQILWKRGSYTICFWDYDENSRRKKYSSISGASVQYGKEIVLSEIVPSFDPGEKATDYALIGWNIGQEPTSFESDHVDYTPNDTFMLESGLSGATVNFYAIWGKRPDAEAYAALSPTVDASHVSMETVDLKDNVRYTYIAPGSSQEVELADGDISVFDKDKTYTVYIHIYRVYTKENIVASRKVREINVRKVKEPSLSISEDALTAANVPASGVLISIDGVARGTLAEQEDYFLRGESAGIHTITGSISYEDNGVYYRSTSSLLVFTIRDADFSMQISGNTMYIKVDESERENILSASVTTVTSGDATTSTYNYTNSLKSGVVQLSTMGLQKITCTVTFKGSGENVVSRTLKKEAIWQNGRFVIQG